MQSICSLTSKLRPRLPSLTLQSDCWEERLDRILQSSVFSSKAPLSLRPASSRLNLTMNISAKKLFKKKLGTVILRITHVISFGYAISHAVCQKSSVLWWCKWHICGTMVRSMTHVLWFYNKYVCKKCQTKSWYHGSTNDACYVILVWKFPYIYIWPKKLGTVMF